MVTRFVTTLERLLAPRDSAASRAAGIALAGGLIEPLTSRELEILQLMAEGYSNNKIAGKLYLSVNTIKTHAHAVYRKLDACSRSEAVVAARRLGLVDA